MVAKEKSEEVEKARKKEGLPWWIWPLLVTGLGVLVALAFYVNRDRVRRGDADALSKQDE